MPSISKEEIKNIISTFGISNQDTASAPVQVALLTHKIKSLTEHIKINKKDVHSRLGLTKMVSIRKKFLKYIKSQNVQSYQELIQKLGLRR